jgi:hypothetical protein
MYALDLQLGPIEYLKVSYFFLFYLHQSLKIPEPTARKEIVVQVKYCKTIWLVSPVNALTALPPSQNHHRFRLHCPLDTV